MRTMLLVASLLALSGLAVGADENVTADGIPFPTTLEKKVGGTPTKLKLTGAGVYEKQTLKYCAVASYVQDGVTVKDAGQLVVEDCPKVLHLVMLRNVNGRDLHEAITDGIGRTDPSAAVKKEMKRFANRFRTKNTRKGDHIWMINVPGVGLRCNFAGDAFTIKNVEFARAVWSNYFGTKNIGEQLKKDLASRL